VTLEANRVAVTAFYDLMFNQSQPAEAVRRYNPRRGQDQELAENVRRSARRAAAGVWGKKPITRVEIAWT
jgi:predicted SnoaL-like aldol condensation-catalyzing enzyme